MINLDINDGKGSTKTILINPLNVTSIEVDEGMVVIHMTGRDALSIKPHDETPEESMARLVEALKEALVPYQR